MYDIHHGLTHGLFFSRRVRHSAPPAPRFVPAIRRTAAQNRRRRAAVVAAPLAAALAVIFIVSHSLSFDRLSALTVTRDTPWRNGGSRALR